MSTKSQKKLSVKSEGLKMLSSCDLRQVVGGGGAAAGGTYQAGYTIPTTA